MIILNPPEFGRCNKASISITFQQRKHGAGQLAKVDSEVLVLGQDVREESLVGSQLRLVQLEGHSLIKTVDGELHDDGVGVKVEIAAHHIANSKLPAVTFKLAVVGDLGRASVTETILHFS